MSKTDKDLKQIQDILNGDPVKVEGVAKIGSEILCLFKTTTGSAYVPYDFVKKHFPDHLIDLIVNSSKFRRFQKNKS